MTPETLPVLMIAIPLVALLILAWGVRGPTRVVMLLWYVRGLSPFNRAVWGLSRSVRRTSIALGRALLPVARLFKAAIASGELSEDSQ